MVVDSVNLVTTPKQCFCEVVDALLQLLLSVDNVDLVFKISSTVYVIDFRFGEFVRFREFVSECEMIKVTLIVDSIL